MTKKYILPLVLVLIIIISLFAACTRIPKDTDNTDNTKNPSDSNTIPNDDITKPDEANNNDTNAGDNNNENSDDKPNDIALEKANIEELVIIETVKAMDDYKYIVDSYLDKAASGKLKFISANDAMKKFDICEIDKTEGIALKDLLAAENVEATDLYQITSSNNDSIGVSRDSIDNGILYMDDDGSYAVKFAGLSEKTNIKKIISISVEKSK